jgi:hypothetical protein
MYNNGLIAKLMLMWRREETREIRALSSLLSSTSALAWL